MWHHSARVTTGPRLQILAAALLFSTGGAAVKLTALDNWQVAGFRSAIAALVFLLLVGTRRGFTWRAWLVGLAYGATLVTFVTANKLTTAANAVFFQAAAPFYLMLASRWLPGEHVSRRDLGYLALLAAGLVLLFAGEAPPAATAPDPARGNVIGALSGMTWAATLAGLRWLGRPEAGHGTSAAAATVCGNLVAAAVCLPLALPAHGSPQDWLVVLYLGCFQVGLAYVLVTRAISHVRALDASLLLLAEPAFSPVWAWLVHGERPSLPALAGGALIIAVTTVRAQKRN
jgi:drug/metabolite transporter (DMT)-like permease